MKFRVCVYKEKDINSIIYASHEIEVGTALFISFRNTKNKKIKKKPSRHMLSLSSLMHSQRKSNHINVYKLELTTHSPNFKH